MICPNCGSELKDGAKFCVECGMPVTEEILEPAPVSEEPAEAVPEKTLIEEAPASEPSAEAASPVESAPVAEPPTEAPSAAEEPAAPVSAPEPSVEPAAAKEPIPTQVVVTAGTDPRMLLTTAQYFFLTILFHIPVIGLIFLFVWGIGRPRNLSLKRFSLAMLILRLVGCLITLALTVLVLLGLNGVIPNIDFSFNWPMIG